MEKNESKKPDTVATPGQASPEKDPPNPPVKEREPDRPRDTRAVRPEGIKDEEQSDTEMMTRSPETSEGPPVPVPQPDQQPDKKQ